MNNGLSQNRTRVFISYSHKDAKYLDELLAHLALPVRQGLITSWSDRNISPGSIWKNEIIQAVNSAKVAIFLVSADFFASDFIAEHELAPLLAAAEREEVVILSVIVGACMFKATPLANFQAINAPSNPLNTMPSGKRDEVWLKVADFIMTGLQSDR
jgi:hypothetical protein